MGVHVTNTWTTYEKCNSLMHVRGPNSSSEDLELDSELLGLSFRLQHLLKSRFEKYYSTVIFWPDNVSVCMT